MKFIITLGLVLVAVAYIASWIIHHMVANAAVAMNV